MLLAMCLVGSLFGCAPRYQVMERTMDASFPGSTGDASRYESQRERWTRDAALGLRGTAYVTLMDPSLGADWLAHKAMLAGREVSPGYDRGIWEGLYGERSDRLPFEVFWRFDKLFQPARITNPKTGWTFWLHDDHGRSWEPMFIDDADLGMDADAWTGRFKLWFPTQDVLKGPLFDGRTGKLTLRIVGPPGAAEFVWKFRPDIGAPVEQ